MNRIKMLAFALLIAGGASLIGGSTWPCSAQAQGGCASDCRAAYGNCYRSTSNRAACEGQMQRCLQGCIATKRG